MTEVLLKELNNPDIDWMLAVGQHQTLDPNTVLIRPGQRSDTLYILLEGGLTAALAQTNGWQEITRLSSGEMIGAVPGLDAYGRSACVSTLTQCLVLVIPQAQLTEKLQQDLSFAAHLHRASAVLLLHQLARLVDQLGVNAAILNQPQLREGLTVFAELQDSDLDWLIAAGQVQHITANTVLVHSGRPVDALHILLDGALSLSTAEVEQHQLANAFSFQSNRPSEQEFARLSRGEIVGETLFVESPLSTITVRALRDSQILSIPRWRLAAKLLHDVGFASRFYRVLSMLLANKYQAIVRQLGQSNQNANQTTNDFTRDSQFLTQVGLAEARFEWMLKRIQTHTGRKIQW
ncbi:MAG: cyclic nucleotide-binding domain-containing protein [Cyanobacteria bacterium RM1_2_2]|nr:cyclic nucleotide-binding domain-containing protein [Cyanobacteria bacterium RM1_2_2]